MSTKRLHSVASSVFFSVDCLSSRLWGQ